MKMERDATTARSVARVTGRGSAAPGVVDWVDGRQARNALDALPDRAPRYIARAPGRFDIMGGFVDYSGGSVLFTPTAARAYVALQPRDDDKLFILQPGEPSQHRKEPTVVSLSELSGHGSEPIPVTQAREIIGDDECGVTRSVVGTVMEAIRAGLIARCQKGFTIAVVLNELRRMARTDSGKAEAFATHSIEDCGSLNDYHTAISAATLAALTSALDSPADDQQAVAVCQAVANLWFDLPDGRADADCVWRAEPETWQEVQYVPFVPGKSLLPPDSFELVALHCGLPHTGAADKFTEARVAAFMGRLLIDRIIESEGAGDIRWDGHLSRITVEQYVDRFRDRIPTKLKGRDFLDRFGETGDPLTRVNPETAYKIRSRTEHHIYEQARSKQFLGTLVRISGEPNREEKSSDRAALTTTLTQLGEVMYASHWSYGQRCGLGCIKADRLVSLIRQRGPAAGLFGARITGRGCGGVVAVLMESSDRARAALSSVIDEYQALMGKTIMVERGSIPGAMSGARRV